MVKYVYNFHSGGSDVDTFKPMVEESGLRITAQNGKYQIQ